MSTQVGSDTRRFESLAPRHTLRALEDLGPGLVADLERDQGCLVVARVVEVKMATPVVADTSAFHDSSVGTTRTGGRSG